MALNAVPLLPDFKWLNLIAKCNIGGSYCRKAKDLLKILTLLMIGMIQVLIRVKMMKNIDDLIQEHKLLYAIFAQKNGTIRNNFGDKTALKYIGVLEQYFGDQEKIIATSEFLLGKQLPQSVMQGNQCCLLTVLDDSVISGVFFLDASSVFVRRKRLKIIHDDMLNLDLRPNLLRK